MPVLSVIIPEHLSKQLESKRLKMGGLKTSDVVRILLNFALEHHDKKTPKITVDQLEQQAKQYTVMSYCLMEKLIAGIEDGPLLWDEAHAKAEKIINSFIQKAGSE